MRKLHTIVLWVLVASVAAGCGAHRKWGRCARTGAGLGGIAGGLAGGLSYSEYANNPNTTETAAVAVGGVIGGAIIGALVGHAICDPEVEAPPPPPAKPAPPPAATPKPLAVLHGPQFDFNRYVLKASGKQKVDEVARYLQQHPDVNVQVDGYTDSIGSDAYNLKLSERRAKAVRDALVADGVSADRITMRGLGKANPVADNDTAEGRAENRRVEIVPAR